MGVEEIRTAERFNIADIRILTRIEAS